MFEKLARSLFCAGSTEQVLPRYEGWRNSERSAVIESVAAFFLLILFTFLLWRALVIVY